jgi:hypothetical protein
VEPSHAIFTSQFTPRLSFDQRHSGSRVRVLGVSVRQGVKFMYEIQTRTGETAWVAPWEIQPLDKEVRV